MSHKPAILLLSGGIDSTVALALYRSWGAAVHAITFDYGQTLATECGVAKRNAEKYAATFQQIDIDPEPFAAGCSLLDRSVHIATDRSLDDIDQGTPTSYVPFRNGIFLAYAVAIGEVNKIPYIVCGGNGLQSGQYPDDTGAFAKKFEAAAEEGTAPAYHPVIEFPNAHKAKADVVATGVKLGVDFSQTLSCYDPIHRLLLPARHCGHCDSCVQRIAAMFVNGMDIEGFPL